jgi:hypothetical protein
LQALSLIEKTKGLFVVYQTTSHQLASAFILSEVNKEKAISTLQAKKKISQRMFSGYQIIDLSSTTKENFSYVFIDNYLVVGPPLFVEDIIRMTTVKDKISFKEQHNALFQLANLKSDDGNLYVNLSQLSQVRSVIGDKGVREVFSSSSIYDIKINQNQVLLNGFAADSSNEISFLSLFREQHPQEFFMKEILPLNSVLISHYSITNLDQWFKRQNSYVDKKSPILKTEIVELKKKFEWSAFKNQIGAEVAVCYIQMDEKVSPVFLLRSEKAASFDTFKNLLNTDYSESHAGYEFKKINIPFVNRIFWPLSTDGDLNYITTKDNYFLFAESPEVLKSILNENENDNTIGKSIAWNKFLSTTLQESTINYFATENGLQMATKAYAIDPNQFEFSTLDKVAIQFSRLDVNFYSNVVLEFADNDTTKNVLLTSLSEIIFESLILKPQIVINHSDKDNEIILQDSLNRFHLISKNKIAWSKQIDRIRGQVTQIDYFNNKKLQYFFTTKDQLHLVDRLGRNVNGFPKQYVGSDFLSSRVVDYDQSKSYRFLVTNQNGSIFMFDDKGSALEGWNPKLLPTKSIDAGHQRILGKDYFFSLLEDGSFYLFNRKGEILKNFPVATHGKVTGCFYTTGQDLKSSYFSLISRDGTLFQVNISGGILKNEPLLKSLPESQFGLLPTQGEQVLISRVDKTKIAVFDNKGNLLFEKQNPLSEQIEFGYFYSSNSIITLFDQSQNLAILYDKAGKEILTQPLETTQPPVIYFSETGRIKVVYSVGNKLLTRLI